MTEKRSKAGVRAPIALFLRIRFHVPSLKSLAEQVQAYGHSWNVKIARYLKLWRLALLGSLIVSGQS